MIKDIRRIRSVNATIVVREDIDVEQMLDVLAGNRVYIKR